MIRKAFILAVAALFVATPALAQMPSPNAPLTVMPVRGGVYWVQGGVSNTGFIVGDQGVIAIDAGFFVQGAKNELAEIAKITPKPVDAVIITHSDPDHINGLPAFPKGVKIIAQDNAKAEMVSFLANPRANGMPAPPEIKDYLPTRTVAARETLVLDGVKLVLLHVAPAHTDGDLIIYLPVQKIVFAGDILTPAVGPYPGIHLNKQGASLGWIETVKAILALDADTFISGHGAPETRVEVKARLKAAIERRAQIKALVDQHMSLEQVKTALNDQPLTGAAAIFPTFVETTYRELTAK